MSLKFGGFSTNFLPISENFGQMFSQIRRIFDEFSSNFGEFWTNVSQIRWILDEFSLDLGEF